MIVNIGPYVYQRVQYLIELRKTYANYYHPSCLDWRFYFEDMLRHHYPTNSWQILVREKNPVKGYDWCVYGVDEYKKPLKYHLVDHESIEKAYQEWLHRSFEEVY